MKRHITNFTQLLNLALKNPSEFLDRLSVIFEARINPGPGDRGYYQPIMVEQALARLSSILRSNVKSYLEEQRLQSLEAEVASRLNTRASQSSIRGLFDADRALARICYGLCRARKPRIAIETGVAHGVTAAYLLEALEANGEGMLVSIDLPPLGADRDRDVGLAVPDRLRRRWHLRFGTSRRVLPEVLKSHGLVDMFVHDSLHTYRNMHREFATVAPHLTPGAILISDDIESNTAFREWLTPGHLIDGFAMRNSAKAGLLFGVGVTAKRA